MAIKHFIDKERNSTHNTKKQGALRKRRSIQFYRKMVQFGFLAVILWIGLEFVLFVSQLEKGGTPSISSRPPGVEGFLPISGLIGLKYWLLAGILNKIHPASVVLLLIILITAIFLKKGFCSWVCPIGLLSEWLAKLHRIIFKGYNFLPKWLDYPLRSLKYLLMIFFVWAVFWGMNTIDLQRFIYSPYNKVVDIKMLDFFMDISSLTFWVLAALLVLSIIFPYFWCRFLCPYGALLGSLSWLSPLKIRRNAESCIDCNLCTKVCPSNIKVHKSNTVFSDECHSCFRCVDACPVKDTLYLSATKSRLKLSGKVYALIIVSLFLIGTAIARLGGYWQTSIPIEEYKYHISHINEPAYHHNRGKVPDYDPDQFRKMEK